MEQRLEAIRSSVQKLAVVLKYGELIILDCVCVTLYTTKEEVSEYVVIPEKRTLSGRIRENMCIYLNQIYYQMGMVLTEKEWNDTTRKKLNSYFRTEKRKSIWKILKRVYQLFTARGEEYLYLVEHINITILEKMYNEDFSDRLLPEAWARRQEELYWKILVADMLGRSSIRKSYCIYIKRNNKSETL
ncbi:27808_t:CDS:2 [Gigaspora margarita]|uniref:27808_t:CDS:1 n=1 Tax=Gigaspora margarita TaxID=4874 RepID=A0ABN7VW52_GIGMA|nr:27808_t:CDS:2 [Gigaspora margarita]